MKLVLQFIIAFFTLVSFQDVSGQKKNASYEKYISLYSELAVEHQKKYQIPASIKLAQALLESGAGQAQLAKQSNNHFGIKCHSDWKGKRVYKKDDNPNDCFRKYKNVVDSYEDHSRFLVDRSRYASLFKLKQNDYKGWAKGLQKCGYATDRKYSTRLIGIIETYELYLYDSYEKSSKNKQNVNKKTDKRPSQSQPLRDTYKNNGLVYVLACSGDSFENIAHEFGLKSKNLIKYNESLNDVLLNKGDIVYLVKKKKKASKPYYNHKVQKGESMYYISQSYGIRIKSLYKMNGKDPSYTPKVGDMLKLR